MNMEQMNHLMNQKNMTAEERERAASLDESMAAGRDLWQEMTVFAQQFAIAITPMIDIMVTGFQKVNSILQAMRDSFISLGDIIAFVFATAGIYKFVMAMKALVAWKKKAAYATWAEAAAEAAKKALGGPIAWGVLAGSAAVAGGAMMALKAATKSKNQHQDGIDATNPEGDPILVGEKGPEVLVAPPHSAVINNTTMTALAEQGAAGGGGDNAAVLAAVNAQTQAIVSALTALNFSPSIVIGKDKIGKVINEHLGEEGSAPIRLKA